MTWKLYVCSYSCRAENAENQKQNLNLQLAELQGMLNSQPGKVSTIKGHWLGRRWDPEKWNEDTWKALAEATDPEPLNSDESFCQWKQPLYSQWKRSFQPQWNLQ